MILVRNHLQQLSGNKLVLVFVCGLIIFASGCTPRFSKPRHPIAKTDPIEKKDTTAPSEKQPEITEKAALKNQIALLLPFQLGLNEDLQPTAQDAKQAALALDFYQGFKIGLDEVASRGTDFQLNVLDTRDNEPDNIRIAQLPEVQEAMIVVGPVFPKEIKAFSQYAGLKEVLQISPLAASMPSEFGNPNLVTLTSPLAVHTQSLISDITKRYKGGDLILIYRTPDAVGKQFVDILKSDFSKHIPTLNMHELSDVNDIEEEIGSSNTVFVICGSTNKYQVSLLTNTLISLQADRGVSFQLYGHPNWDKMGFEAEDNLAIFNTRITSSYYINKRSTDVRQFDELYQKTFEINASEFAYKGYDAARYFGGLLKKYGSHYKEHILQEEYNGLHNTFRFGYDPSWGYVNDHVSILQYRNGSFQLAY